MPSDLTSPHLILSRPRPEFWLITMHSSCHCQLSSVIIVFFKQLFDCLRWKMFPSAIDFVFLWEKRNHTEEDPFLIELTEPNPTSVPVSDDSLCTELLPSEACAVPDSLRSVCPNPQSNLKATHCNHPSSVHAYSNTEPWRNTMYNWRSVQMLVLA